MQNGTVDAKSRVRDAGLFLVVWALWFFLMLAVGRAVKDYLPGKTAAYLVSGALELLLLMPAAAYLQMRRIGVAELLGKPVASQIAAAAFLGMLLMPATLPLTAFWELLIRLTGGALPAAPKIPIPQSIPQFLAAFAVLAFAAPVAEEPLMRGLALRGARPLGRAAAIALVSAVFALIHGSLVDVVPIFLVGAVLGALAWRSGSLWPSMAAHGAFNATSLAVGTAMAHVSEKMGGQALFRGAASVSNLQLFLAACEYLLAALPIAAPCLAVLWAFFRHTPPSPRPEPVPQRVGFSGLWPWVLTVLLLAGYLSLDILRVYGIIG